MTITFILVRPISYRFVQDVKNYPVFEEGRKIRYQEKFQPGGTTVNFVELQATTLFLSGPMSVVLKTKHYPAERYYRSGSGGFPSKGAVSPVSINTLGGKLAVEFKSGQSGTFQEIYLIGPAKMVFKGQLEL